MAKLVSIAIEDAEIKLLVVDGRKVTVADRARLEAGLVKDGVVLDKAAVSQKLRKLLETNKVASRRVLASVSGMHSIYRVIGLPKLPKALMEEAVTREAERIMPVPLSEVHFFWQEISLSGEEAWVCLLGLPKATVDNLRDTLRECGLEPYTMDARPLAAARACGETRAIAINVERSDFDIAVVTDGIPELVRSLAFSKSDLLPPDKAAEVKEELDRTIRFYNASHEATPIKEDTPVVVGSEPTLTELLKESLPYRVDALSVPLSCPADFNAGEFMTNIGLVFKEMKFDRVPLRVNLNTIPEVRAAKRIPVTPIITWFLVVVAAVCVAWFWFMTRDAADRTLELRQEVKRTQELVKARQIDPKEVKEAQAELAETTAVRHSVEQSLGGLEEQRAEVAGDLGKVMSLLPGDVGLEDVKYGANTVVIRGVATDSGTILKYARSLRESGGFSEVQVFFETAGERKVEFAITLK